MEQVLEPGAAPWSPGYRVSPHYWEREVFWSVIVLWPPPACWDVWLWGNVTSVPWTVWVNWHSPEAILPCGSSWLDMWSAEFWDCKLLSILGLYFFYAFSAFSCALLGNVAFLRIGLLVTTFSSCESCLGWAEVLQRPELGVFCSLGPARWEHLGPWAEEWWEAVLGHLLGSYQLDGCSYCLESCQPEALAILGNNRWGQLTSGTSHILHLYSPCLSGH